MKKNSVAIGRDVPFGGTFAKQALANMSSGTRRSTTREIENLLSSTLVAGAREEGRALLTNAALQNIGALTALEQHLIQIAPLGEARYRFIVDAYALGAAMAIQGW